LGLSGSPRSLKKVKDEKQKKKDFVVEDFIQELLLYSKSYESPTSFWRWAGYSAIAAVIRDNVWLEDGDSKLYPNIYVLFLAHSAERKGRPITVANKLVHEINNTKIISGRSSIQAILQDLGKTETDKHGHIKRGGSAIVFAPEFSASLVADDQAIQILTDIYEDKPSGHTINLVGLGKIRIEKVVFSLLGASNHELLKSMFNIKAIEGGLLARTFLVVPDEFRPSNAFPQANNEGFAATLGHLLKIAAIRGPVVWTKEAKEFYKDFYEGERGFRVQAKDQPDRAGILGRIPTSIKKLAAIKAVNTLQQEINLCHIKEATEESLNLLKNYSAFQISQGKSVIALAGSIVLEELYKANGNCCSREVLIRDHWFDFDTETLDKVIVAFEASKLISSKIEGNNLCYKLSKRGKQIMEGNQELVKREGQGA
jgi:hypothetical protein